MALLLTSFAAVSCGSSPGDRAAGSSVVGVPPGTSTAAATRTGAPSSFPLTVTDGSGRSVTVESVDRIIPLDGDLAEIVFALGLGERVVATDLSATYPPEADALPQIGYQRALSAEPVLAFEPTVLLATPSAGPAEVVDQLRGAVPLVLIDAPTTLAGPAAKIRAVAAALGVPERGEEVARGVERDIASALATLPAGGRPPVVAALYLRGERVQQVFGPGSTIHAVLHAVGAVDIGEQLGVEDNQPITAEAMADARPEVLIVTSSGLDSVGGLDGLLSLPAFSHTPVAASRRVLVFEDQYLYGFGPRTGRLVAELVAGLYGDEATAGAPAAP